MRELSIKYGFDLIGYFGPMIMSVISIAKLWKQSSYLYGYLVFSLINFAVNGIVKTIAKQPRPYGGQSIINEHYVGVNKYGMPSGHTQSVFFSMTYLYLITNSSGLLLIEMFIAALTLYQRWNYRQHTIEQLCVGAFIGICVAYGGFYITQKWIVTGI